jgi:hypothetical protein
MRDRKSDRQMSFGFPATKSSNQTAKQDRSEAKGNVFNLRAHQIDMHGRSILQRVIKEGYVKPKS